MMELPSVNGIVEASAADRRDFPVWQNALVFQTGNIANFRFENKRP